MSPFAHKPRLFALLVAINEYRPPVPPLSGCIPDLQKVTAYLMQEADYFELVVEKLLNEAATKAAVVDQISRHLGQATGNDVVLFYFSGHGTQEDADPVFWPAEADRKLESLVCYDHLNLLADKELRYLISTIAKQGAHILTVFDCCHSGGNTRNAYIAEQTGDVRERRYVNRERLSQSFPVRAWKDFIFADRITYEAAKAGPIAQLLPEGTHIQLAACQDDQSAYEVGGAGVFTKNLLEVLSRCGGDVTYYDLESRLQNYLKNQFHQMPRVYIAGHDERGLFQGFLGKRTAGRPVYGNINFNPVSGWIMDMGAMHGISARSPAVRVVTLDEKTEYPATVNGVYPSYTSITFESGQPDTQAHLKGYPSGCSAASTGVYIDVSDAHVRDGLLQLVSQVDSGLFIAPTILEAAYGIYDDGAGLRISRPDAPGIPVVPPQPVGSDNDLVIIRNYLLHLAQFEFVKGLHNPNAFLYTKDPVEVCVFGRLPGGQAEEPIPVNHGEVRLNYTQQNDGKWGGNIRIALKNRTDHKVYCALLYLSFNFGVTTKLLNEVVVGLEPNQEVWAMDGAPIGLTLEDEVIAFGYRESVSYLKLMVSSTEFKQQVTRLEMPSLPGPTVTTGSRGLATPAYEPGNMDDWTTRLITISIKNPLLSLVVFLYFQQVFYLVDQPVVSGAGMGVEIGYALADLFL